MCVREGEKTRNERNVCVCVEINDNERKRNEEKKTVKQNDYDMEFVESLCK